MLRRQLNRVKHTNDLIEVAPGRHGIRESELDPLIRSNDKNRSHWRIVSRCSTFGRVTRIGREHVIELRNLQLRIADQRIVHLRSADLFNVHSPLVMVPDRVHAKADDLGTTPGEVVLQIRHRAKLGGTHWRKVLWMREENCPIVANPFMEVNRAMSRFCNEIRSNIVDTE